MRKVYTSIVSVVFVAALSLCAAVYEIGPQKPYEKIGNVPWGALLPGDSVLIHYRSEPYKEKWVICLKGTANDPIVISGVADNQGQLPVIDGNEAVTDTQFNFWNEERGLIKIGGANNPADIMPEYIVLQNLDIQSAREGYTFTGRYGITNYFKNAAAVYIEKGEHITIRNCVLRDCGNGLFSASQSKDVLVEACYIYDNGHEDSIYEHNNYTESQGITFQYNRFGPLRDGCLGNNLKDRSSGCVIRYNWIEGGNRQLDLVQSDHQHIVFDPAYAKTFVYGNTLIEPDKAGNSQICHYGGDDYDSLQNFRKGMLYFYHNTIVSTRSNNTTLLRLSSDDESADVRNNSIYVTASGSHLAIVDSAGKAIDLRNNWLNTGWVKSHTDQNANVNDSGSNITGAEPGFLNFAKQDFRLLVTSPCKSGATMPAQECIAEHSPKLEYVKHQSYKDRYADAVPDIGAFECDPNMDSKFHPVKNTLKAPATWCSPNPFTHSTVLHITMPDMRNSEVVIYNNAGQVVRTIRANSYLLNYLTWDGRDNAGGFLPGGLYYYYTYGITTVAGGRIILIR